MELVYCRRCGSELMPDDQSFTCHNEHRIFANPVPAVGVIFITNDQQVILARRGIEPHKGMLDAFGGFVDVGESFEAAAQRELIEELHVQPAEYEPLHYAVSATGNYPYKDETLPTLSVIFWTRLKTNRPLTPADDVAEIVTLPLATVNLDEVHDDDVRAGLKALQKMFLEKGEHDNE